MIILWLLKLGITMLIHKKDDIEFVTELICFWDTLQRVNWEKNISVCEALIINIFSLTLFSIFL